MPEDKNCKLIQPPRGCDQKKKTKKTRKKTTALENTGEYTDQCNTTVS